MREESEEPNSETRIELSAVRSEWARYGIISVTCRKHQIRAYCALLGIPIRHNQLSRCRLREDLDDYAQPPPLLAKASAFREPQGVEARSLTSAGARKSRFRDENIKTAEQFLILRFVIFKLADFQQSISPAGPSRPLSLCKSIPVVKSPS